MKKQIVFLFVIALFGAALAGCHARKLVRDEDWFK